MNPHVVPPPITPGRVLLDWSLDPVTAAVVVAAGVGYLVGVRRLARREVRWPTARTACFATGLLVVVAATQSGLARYDTVLISAHAGQHLLLGMVAPLLLALGAPITLALQATERPVQRRLARALHHPVVRFVGHPVVAWLAYVAVMVGLWFSPSYELSLRNDVAHQWTHLVLLGTGYAFCWAVAGLDGGARQSIHPVRLLLVLLTVPVHAVVGLALMGSSTVLAGDWYEELGRTWGASALGDQHTAGGLLWAAGDLVTLALGGIVMLSWMRHEDRAARRLDRLGAVGAET